MTPLRAMRQSKIGGDKNDGFLDKETPPNSREFAVELRGAIV
jgi:hypothetical protein